MSYLVLARKWRPRSFDTLVGQDHVVRALTHALSSGRLHHAWLFTGTRGVGKTTLSRILAKSLNCADGVTATPCGHCQACTEIDAGRFVDYIELDAASNRGVDEMTQLLEQAVYAPSSGRYKVYMIDEVHMLTGHAFNAMLKTLEEPPEHVKFILATTDPQKIPVTVLSRCLQFNLKQMTVPAIVQHLQQILVQENIPADTQSLRLIAQAAAGSMRDALSLADQAISFAAGNLTAQAVGEMLGTLDQHHLVALARALAAADAAAVLAVADDLALRGLSFRSALADLAILLSRVAIAQRLGHAPENDPQAEDIQSLAGLLSPDDVQLFYSVAVHSRQELALAPDEYAGFVMACLRMLALLPADRVPPVPSSAPPVAVKPSSPAGDVAALPASHSHDTPAWEASPSELQTAAVQAQPDVLQSPSQQPVSENPAASGNPALDDQPVPDDAQAADDWTTGIPDASDDGSEPGMAVFGADDTLAEQLGGLSGVPAPTAAAQVDPASLTSTQWPTLAASLPVTGAARALALNSEWQSGDEHQIHLRVAIHTLTEGGAHDRLRTVLSEHFGRVLQLQVDYGDTGGDTAYALDQAARGRRLQAAEQAAQQAPLVQALVQQFGARIVPGSVQPPAV
ncbi:DNA polymerase III subunit gamma/tau [Castellaniella sp. FW104-16D08]|uniref:DNA polymerase III subunit gamma/tau n=1 Tax=unclassified Castellaniella TaxID=2617606 RepID=UPI003314AD22